MLRILGHCLIGINNNNNNNNKKNDKNKNEKNKELHEAACRSCRSLYARAVHDINPKAILATGSLLKLIKLNSDPKICFDHIELPVTNTINL